MDKWWDSQLLQQDKEKLLTIIRLFKFFKDSDANNKYGI